MGGAQSVPERIRLCAKKGDYHALKVILTSSVLYFYFYILEACPS